MSEGPISPDGISPNESGKDNRTALLTEVKTRLAEAGEGARLDFVGQVEDGSSVIITANYNKPKSEQITVSIGQIGDMKLVNAPFREWNGPHISSIEGSVPMSDNTTKAVYLAFPYPYDKSIDPFSKDKPGPRYGQVIPRNNHGYIITGPDTLDIGDEVQTNGRPLTEEVFEEIVEEAGQVSDQLRVQRLTPTVISEDELRQETEAAPEASTIEIEDRPRREDTSIAPHSGEQPVRGDSGQEREQLEFLTLLERYANDRERKRGDLSRIPMAASFLYSIQRLLWTYTSLEGFRGRLIQPGPLLNDPDLVDRLTGLPRPGALTGNGPSNYELRKWQLAVLERIKATENLLISGFWVTGRRADTGAEFIRTKAHPEPGRFERTGSLKPENPVVSPGTLILEPAASTRFTDAQVGLADPLRDDPILLDNAGRPTNKTITAEPILELLLTVGDSEQLSLYPSREGLIVVHPSKSLCYPHSMAGIVALGENGEPSITT